MPHPDFLLPSHPLTFSILPATPSFSFPPSPLSLLHIQYYRKPLLALTTTSQPILAERDINTIFYRTEDLVELHTTLHEKLETQLREWTVNTCVGDFFVELVSVCVCVHALVMKIKVWITGVPP